MLFPTVSIDLLARLDIRIVSIEDVGNEEGTKPVLAMPESPRTNGARAGWRIRSGSP